MRIAIHNPFAGGHFAETELARRLCLAASNLGWEAIEAKNSIDIHDFVPDFVVALHSNEGKVTPYPTYGCMWNPPSFFERNEKSFRHILSYDAYLISSGSIHQWLKQFLCNTGKHYFTTPFYTSCPKNQYREPDLTQPRLVYLGSNWDGVRFQELFEALDTQDDIDVYGSPTGWTHLRQIYRGTLPYDGSSVFETLNRAGVGLCLHKDQHRQAAIPSMRIFEIVASGAIALCGEHPFIREVFGDTVLYLDVDLSPADLVAQIAERMAWIRTHPSQALAMSAGAHDIFVQHYTLEHLLQGIVPHHQALLQAKGFVRPVQLAAMQEAGRDRPDHAPQVQVILPIQDTSAAAVQRSLESIAVQSYLNVEAIAILSQPIPEFEEWIAPYQGKLPIRVLSVPPTAFCSTPLWAGLNAVTTEYFAVLASGEVWYPNHLMTLVQRLQQFPAAGVAYAGAVRRLMQGKVNPRAVVEFAEVAYMQPLELDLLLLFDPPIAPNSFVVRRCLLDAVLRTDPELKAGEILCLLLQLSLRSPFTFSYEVTCEFNQTEADLATAPKPFADAKFLPLKTMFWRQEFAPGKSIQTVHQAQLDYQRLEARTEQVIGRLNEAKGRIEAMETSKFWQLRSTWFKLKRTLGLPVDEE